MPASNAPIKFCRHCGRLIRQDAVDCPYCGANTIKYVDQKECPFCGEPVRRKAVKCKHCGEFLDGRQQARDVDRQVIYVDKAVITGGPDGNSLELAPPDAEAPPGQAAPFRLRLPWSRPKALPAGPGTDLAQGARPPEAAPVGRLPARPVEALPPKPIEVEARPVAPAAEVEEPPVRYECPSCRNWVYEGDNFCENCGRNLKLAPGKSDVPAPTRRYGLADVALMVAAGAPLGFLADRSVVLAVAALGVVLSLWSLGRTAPSDGRLRGTGAAAVGLTLGLLWVVVSLAIR